jgi:hypothetical protein
VTWARPRSHTVCAPFTAAPAVARQCECLLFSSSSQPCSHCYPVCICMHVCIYVFMDACMVCVCVLCIYVCIHVCIRMYACMYVYTYVCMFICMYVCIYLFAVLFGLLQTSQEAQGRLAVGVACVCVCLCVCVSFVCVCVCVVCVCILPSMMSSHRRLWLAGTGTRFSCSRYRLLTQTLKSHGPGIVAVYKVTIRGLLKNSCRVMKAGTPGEDGPRELALWNSPIRRLECHK